MGTVAMGKGGSIKWQGSTISQTAYCLYCDKCGSFKIGKRITRKMFLGVMIPAIIATALFNTTEGAVFPVVWLFCLGSQLLLIGVTGVLDFGYYCKKCGNKLLHTKIGNVMNFPENDQSVLDVPYERTVKFYYDDY